jgi:subtilisin family serine protease
MRAKGIISACITLALLFTSLPVSAKTQTATINPEFLQEASQSQEWFRILIEFKDLPGIEHWLKKHPPLSFQTPLEHRDQLLEQSAPYQNLLMEKQEAFVDWASEAGIKLIPDQHLLLVLNAMTAEIRGCDIPKLLSYRQIYHIYDDRPVNRLLRHTMARTTGAEKVWKGISSENIPASKGNKMLIGIIDSGLDRNHPEFKKALKIKGGYNVVDSSGNYDDERGHGTHVAGIAAGQGDKVERQGMAYEAQLMIYKAASSRYPGAIINWMVAADRSVKDKCDVINLSFGRNTDDSSRMNSTEHRCIANLDKAGVFVVAAAGNEGPRRKEIPWTISSPSIVEEAFSVAASDDRKEEATMHFNPGKANDRLINATHASPTPQMNAEILKKGIVFAEYGRKEDLSSLQLKDKVALIKRGPSKDPLLFRDKVENALQKGASGVILFNDVPSEVMFPALLGENEEPEQARHLPPTLMVTLEDGEYIQSIIKENIEVNVRYQSFRIISRFTSMGPSGDIAFKPEISVPGTEIVSPVPKNKYAAWDGTSMASPGMAGLCALVKQARPKWSHSQIKSAFMNTADIMINPQTSLPITFLVQGAGSARLDRTLATPAFIEPRTAIFKEASPKVSQVFTVSNAKSTKQTFKLSAEFFHHAHEKLPIKASFDANEITIDPNQQAEFIYTLEMDRNSFLQSRYEGVVRLGNELQIPIICYRDSPNRLEDAISNIRISEDRLDLTSSNAVEQDIYLSFSLNAGDFFCQNYRDYDIYNSFNFTTVYISLADRSGETWAELKPLVGAMVGEYRIKWNAKNSKDRYFLPKGTYTFTVATYKYELINNTWERRLYASSRQSFHIIKSTIPDPIPASFTALKMYGERQTLNLGLKFDDINSLISQTEDITSISLELKYDSNRLSYREYQTSGFLVENNPRVRIDRNAGDGILVINIDCKNLSSSKINNLPFINLVFRTGNQGRVAFTTRAFQVILDNEDEIRVKAITPNIRIFNKPFLLTDLNNDKVVDRFDMEIFNQSYGYIKGEKNYNENCDFNQDQRVDMLDYWIISKEMGSDIL